MKKVKRILAGIMAMMLVVETHGMSVAAQTVQQYRGGVKNRLLKSPL